MMVGCLRFDHFQRWRIEGMLLVLILCCVTSLFALDDEKNVLSVQAASSQRPPLNMPTLPLELYKLYNVGNEKIQLSNPLQREEKTENKIASTQDCPNIEILLKTLNILRNLLPQSSNNILEPGKLQFVLSIIKSLLEKSPIIDENYKLQNLNNLEGPLNEMTMRNRENALRDDVKIKTKQSLQYEIPKTHLECQHVFNVLVNFINNAYSQVARYCKLSGKCNANVSPNFNFEMTPANSYDQPNILSNTSPQNQSPANILEYLSSYNHHLPKFENENNDIDEKNQKMKHNYDILNVFHNYPQKPEIKYLQGLQNAYPAEDSQYKLFNLLTNSNKQSYGLNEINPNQQQSLDLNKKKTDFNTSPLQGEEVNITDANKNENYIKMLANILHNNNNVPNQSYEYKKRKDIFPLLSNISGANSNQDYTKMLDILSNNSIPVPSNKVNENVKKEISNMDFINNIFKLPNYENSNLVKLNATNNTENDEVTNGITLLSKFKNISPKHEQGNEWNQFFYGISNNIVPKTPIIGYNQPYSNPAMDNENLVPFSKYFIQNNKPTVQEKTNFFQQPEVLTKIPQQSNIPNNNLPPYVYQIYKQLLDQNAKVLGSNQGSQNKLNAPNTLTSLYNSYINPSIVNTVPNNKYHENYGNQLPDSSQLLSVSNLIKLNSVPLGTELNYNNRILELTYMLKQAKPVYEPLYYVKYKIPYNEFLYKIQNILTQKPYLRNQPNQVYEELLSSSNIIEASGNLKDLKREELVRLTSTNGTLVDAKVLENNDDKAIEQLKIVQDLNANLSHSLFNLNESNKKPLEAIEKLLNATSSTAFDGSFKNNANPLSDVQRRLSLNDYINSAYNTPVLNPILNYNYNPYSKTMNPVYPYYVSPNRYGYNTLSKNVGLPYINSQNLVNKYSGLAG